MPFSSCPHLLHALRVITAAASVSGERAGCMLHFAREEDSVLIHVLLSSSAGTGACRLWTAHALQTTTASMAAIECLLAPKLSRAACLRMPHPRLRHRTCAGREGLLVSNDEMRDHIFNLLAPKYFFKWKQRHQVHNFTCLGNFALQLVHPQLQEFQATRLGSLCASMQA